MISFQKKCLSFRRIFLINPSYTQFKQLKSYFYQFSSQKQNKNDAQQQKERLYHLCMLSNKVIQIILKKQTTHLKQYSLRDKILEQIEKETEFKNINAKQQIKKLFVDGLQMDQKKKYVFSQNRIIFTQIQRKRSDKIEKYKRITFFPTYFVTSQMFRIIEQYLTESQLIKGHFGFSKTFSMMLYCQLTNNIINYRIKYPNQSKLLPEQIKRRPKVFYWTIDVNTYVQNQYEQFKFIQNNCEQVEHLLHKQNQNTFRQSHVQILIKYLKSGVKLAIFFDQVNKLVSIIRKKWYFKIYSNSENYQDNEQQNKFFRKFMKYKNGIIKYFQTKLGLSSVNIQDKYIKQINLTGQDQHRLIQQTNLDLLKNIYETNTIYELVDFFIFQFGQYVNFNKLDENWNKNQKEKNKKYFQSIRKRLFSFLYKKNGIYFLNHLSMNSYFINQKNKINDIQEQLLPSFFIQQMNRCLNHSLTTLQEKMGDFLNKPLQLQSTSNIKKKILSQIYIKALVCCLQGNPQKFLKPIKFRNINYHRKLKIEMFDTELFQVEQINYNEQYLISFYCCSGILVKILNKILNKQQYYLQESEQNIMDFFFSLFKVDELGTEFQVVMINCLLLIGTQLKINFNNNMKQYKFYKTFANTFKSVPTIKQQKGKSEYSIVQQVKRSIQELIELIEGKRSQTNSINEQLVDELNFPKDFFQDKMDINTQNLSIICLPKLANQSRNNIIPNQRKSNNKAFDLIVINQSREKNENQKRKIQILAIDTTVSQSKSKIQQKIKNFLQTFSSFKQHQKNIIDVSYFNNNNFISEQIEVELKFCVLGCKNQRINQSESTITSLSSFNKQNGQKSSKITKTINVKIQDHPILTQIRVINMDQFSLIHPVATTKQQRFLKIISDGLFKKLKDLDQKTLENKLFLKHFKQIKQKQLNEAQQDIQKKQKNIKK